MIPRDHGFYWVRLGQNWKTQGAWVVAEYEPRGWQVMDESSYYTDAEFDEIEEDRLRSPDEHH